MQMPAGIVAEWLLIIYNVIAMLAVVLAGWRMNHRVLFDLEQGLIIGMSAIFLSWLYTMSAGAAPGMQVHFLGVMLTVMMFGPWLAILVLSAVHLLLTLGFGIGALETLGFNIVMCVVAPTAVAVAIHTFSYYKLPRTFPVYIIQVGIGDLFCMWAVDVLLTAHLLIFTDYIFDKIFYNFSLILFVMGGMEATISTMIASLLIFFLPQALTTFSDQEYLHEK